MLSSSLIDWSWVEQLDSLGLGLRGVGRYAVVQDAVRLLEQARLDEFAHELADGIIVRILLRESMTSRLLQVCFDW